MVFHQNGLRNKIASTKGPKTKQPRQNSPRLNISKVEVQPIFILNINKNNISNKTGLVYFDFFSTMKLINCLFNIQFGQVFVTLAPKQEAMN